MRTSLLTVVGAARTRSVGHWTPASVRSMRRSSRLPVARARLVEQVARELHDHRGAPRLRNDGSFEPGVTDDRADGQLGIANTTFDDLPGP